MLALANRDGFLNSNGYHLGPAWPGPRDTSRPAGRSCATRYVTKVAGQLSRQPLRLSLRPRTQNLLTHILRQGLRGGVRSHWSLTSTLRAIQAKRPLPPRTASPSTSP